MTTTATAPERPRGLRRHRSSLLVLLGFVVAVVVVAVVQGGARSSDPLDPDNPAPQGAQAVARVLADQDVDVTVARGSEELEQARVDADTTVVVTRPDLLGRSTIDRLLRHARPASRLVVVGAGPGAAEELGAPVPSRMPLGEGRDAACDDPVVAGLSLQVDQALAYPGTGCFDGAVGPVLLEGDRNLVLFGADQALTNEQVTRADNAAVVLRLLGQDERLVWYVPELTDLTADDGVGLDSLVPRWIGPGLFLLVLVVGALMLWRGRRLGPLAVEPLPVVVSATETTRSQGRLYRRSADRGHAASVLRAAARHRLTQRLALGSTASTADLVRAVAKHTGRPEPDVHALVASGSVPGTDRDLIALATTLAALEEEVRRG